MLNVRQYGVQCKCTGRVVLESKGVLRLKLKERSHGDTHLLRQIVAHMSHIRHMSSYFYTDSQ